VVVRPTRPGDSAMSNLALLCEFHQALASAESLSCILDNVIECLAKMVDVKHGFLGMVNGAQDAVVVEAVCGPGVEHLMGNACKPHQGVGWEVLRNGTVSVVTDIGGDPLLQGVGDELCAVGRVFVYAPLQWKTVPLGLLGVGYPYPGMEEMDLNLLSLIGSFISPALVLMRVRDDTSLDALLRSKLERAIERMDVHTESQGSLMADVVGLVERSLINAALEKVDYVQLTAARFLGINRNTLRKKMKELGVTIP